MLIFYLFRNKLSVLLTFVTIFFVHIFVISRLTKVLVTVISLSLWLLLITPNSTFIILDITKTSSNNCLLSVGLLAVGSTDGLIKIFSLKLLPSISGIAEYVLWGDKDDMQVLYLDWLHSWQVCRW